MAAGDLVGFDAEAIANDRTQPVRWEEAVVSAQEEPRGHVRPRVERPGLLEERAGLVARRPDRHEHVGRDIVGEASSRQSHRAGLAPTTAASCPVLAHQSPPDSPGRGTIAASNTIRSTGTRVATSGATRPASDCATSTRSPRRSPIASTTTSTYAPAQPLDRTAGPSRRLRGPSAGARPRRDPNTLARPPAPCMQTNVAMSLHLTVL